MAREGVSHWWYQRLTAVALAPLTLWFVWSTIQLMGVDLAGFRAWLSGPVNLVLLILFVCTLFYHMKLGIQVIIEDYVHDHVLNSLGLIATNIVSVVFCVFSWLWLVFPQVFPSKRLKKVSPLPQGPFERPLGRPRARTK